MLEQIIDIVRRAGDIVLSAHDIQNVTREKHGPADLVTQYDEAVQAFLRQELLKLLPEAEFFGEEGERPALTHPWIFVVDPIDGTTNFTRRMNCSSVSVALVHNGQAEYGVVYNPFVGELFAAQRGCGATLNGAPIRASSRDAAHAIVACGSTIYDRSYTDRHFAILRHLYDRCLDYRRFASAALDCCMVACGRAEIFFECRLSPWDYAAGSLIAQEAGGVAVRLDGSFLDPLRPGSVFITNAAIDADPEADHRPNTELPVFADTLHETLDALRQGGVQPVMMTLPPIDGERYLSFLCRDNLRRDRILDWLGEPQMIYRHQELYADTAAEIALRENIPLIPVRQTFLRNHRLSQLIAADGIHLTMGGYEQLFDTLADWVKHNI